MAKIIQLIWNQSYRLSFKSFRYHSSTQKTNRKQMLWNTLTSKAAWKYYGFFTDFTAHLQLIEINLLTLWVPNVPSQIQYLWQKLYNFDSFTWLRKHCNKLASSSSLFSILIQNWWKLCIILSILTFYHSFFYSITLSIISLLISLPFSVNTPLTTSFSSLISLSSFWYAFPFIITIFIFLFSSFLFIYFRFKLPIITDKWIKPVQFIMI